MQYTAYSDVTTYISQQATAKGFNEDCPLNSATKQALVCSQVCNGEDDATIASVTGLTSYYVTQFKNECPTLCPVTPDEIVTICSFKSFGVSLETILSAYGTKDPDSVTEAYNSC